MQGGNGEEENIRGLYDHHASIKVNSSRILPDLEDRGGGNLREKEKEDVGRRGGGREDARRQSRQEQGLSGTSGGSRRLRKKVKRGVNAEEGEKNRVNRTTVRERFWKSAEERVRHPTGSTVEKI